MIEGKTQTGIQVNHTEKSDPDASPQSPQPETLTAPEMSSISQIIEIVSNLAVSEDIIDKLGQITESQFNLAVQRLRRNPKNEHFVGMMVEKRSFYNFAKTENPALNAQDVVLECAKLINDSPVLKKAVEVVKATPNAYSIFLSIATKSAALTFLQQQIVMKK